MSNFTQLLLNQQNIGVTYQEIRKSLSAYIGQAIYIGFSWECSNYEILVDDVKIGHPQVIQPLLNLPENFSFIQADSLTVR